MNKSNIEPLELVKFLNNAFEKEPKHLWKCYYKKFIKNNSWCIASDYCLDAKNKINNCFVYTVFPYINFDFLQKKINEAIPKDIKNINKISQETINMIKSPFFFTIAFIINDKSLFYKNGIKNTSEKNIINSQVKNTYENCLNKAPYIAKKLKLLLKETEKNNFNRKLYSNIFWNSILAAYVNNFIYRYTKHTNGTIWISDRDDMCNYCDGILFDLYNIDSFSIHKINKTKIPKNNKLAICIEGDKSFEFDKLVRIPDYFAGAISSTDFKTNIVDKEKHLKINVDIIADNPRLIIIELFIENNILLYRKIKINKRQNYH